ncbi:hypothetical protein OG753_07940 [Streptomyces sp. NBC_00029]|uniref:hypothetical protein n=1 Tax=Streptomyces sp. NBC_00029 TaxID=2903613 RepID=UPI00324529CB
MTRPFRIRRLALLTASTAVVAGGVLVPTTAFAATPATPHAVAQDSADDGNRSNLMWIGPPGSGSLFDRSPGSGVPDSESPAEEAPPGDFANIPGESDSPFFTRPGHPHWKPQWQCFAAPCEPPSVWR